MNAFLSKRMTQLVNGQDVMYSNIYIKLTWSLSSMSWMNHISQS